jgi:hypothetical protein
MELNSNALGYRLVKWKIPSLNLKIFFTIALINIHYLYTIILFYLVLKRCLDVCIKTLFMTLNADRVTKYLPPMNGFVAELK